MVYLLIRLERALSRPQCLARKPLSIKTDLPSRSYSVFLFFAKKDHSDVSVLYFSIYDQNDAGCKRSKFVEETKEERVGEKKAVMKDNSQTHRHTDPQIHKETETR